MPNILLIEDSDLNRDLISRYLGLFGYIVTSATNGASGLHIAQAESQKFDLILMDMNLPEMDGWEVTRRLKADAVTQTLPVIALTAHAMVGDREKALSAGCDDYATKPIDFDNLISKIEDLCNKASAL